ncbi:MAG: type VI secretion system contractile sheath domain-containing protein, partial [bacterium]
DGNGTGGDDFVRNFEIASGVVPTISVDDVSVIEGDVGTTDATFTISLSKDIYRPGQFPLNLKRVKGFHPDRIIKNNPPLKNLFEARQSISEAEARDVAPFEVSERLKDWPELLSSLETKQRKPKESKAKAQPPKALDNILKIVSLPEGSSKTSTGSGSLISQIDATLQGILATIFSNDAFRNLESVWQGLTFLTKQAAVAGDIDISLFPVSLPALEESLVKLQDILILNPPSLMIIDFPFDSSPRSLALLEKIADFSDLLLTAALGWISPRFLHLEDWEELKKIPYLPHYLEEQTFAKWRRLRESSPARWLTLTCNRFLVRYPYGPDNRPASVYFEESGHPWVSPVWAMASLIGQSLGRTGWPTRFTEWSKVRLENLALHTGENLKQIPTEVSLPEERIHQFVKAGITPLASIHNQDTAFTPAEATVAGGSLSYQLLVSRIIHLILWAKDSLHEDLSPEDLAGYIREALTLFWEKTGQKAPDLLEVSASKPDPEKPATVKIMIAPCRQILPSGEKVVLEFPW